MFYLALGEKTPRRCIAADNSHEKTWSRARADRMPICLLPAFPIEASELSRRVSFQYSSFIFLDELLYSFSRDVQ